MKKISRLLILSFILIIFSCGDELDFGMMYQQTSFNQKSATKVYFYHLTWGLDKQAFYISANKDVCMGFDSTKDFCFNGQTEIYYESKDDTLKIYSSNKPFLPSHFPISFKITEFDNLTIGLYREKFNKGEINKVVFDTIAFEIPCKLVPFYKFNNMKFEKDK